MTRVLFVGNCQAQFIYENFRRAYADSDHKFHYIRSFEPMRPADLAAFQESDLLVAQKGDFADPIVEAAASSIPKVLYFPPAMVTFLWPFAVEAHLKNVTTPFYRPGPYSRQKGDRYLNAALKSGKPTQIISEEYLNLDLNHLLNLDRLYAINAAKVKRQDRRFGTKFWDIIEDNFRIRLTHHTPLHPSTYSFNRMTEVMFGIVNLPDRLSPWALARISQTLPSIVEASASYHRMQL